jgi:hypothetical protein
MVAAARAGRPGIVTLAAALFALTAAVIALASYRLACRGQDTGKGSSRLTVSALWQSSALAAICYAWGAVAMQGLYLTRLTGLKWQHGWEYALAMALLAGASMAFAGSLSRLLKAATLTGDEAPLRWAMPLAAAQACVAGVGLVVLVVSGKAFSTRADWAANRVFVGLAVAILAVCVASIAVQRQSKTVLDAA